MGNSKGLNFAETVILKAQQLVEISHDTANFQKALRDLELALEQMGEFELETVEVRQSKVFSDRE